MEKLSPYREVKIKGYLELLEKAPITGREVHEVKNHICILRLALYAKVDITPNRENRIKLSIRKLYWLSTLQVQQQLSNT